MYLEKCFWPMTIAANYVNAFSCSVTLYHRWSLWHLEKFVDVLMPPGITTAHIISYCGSEPFTNTFSKSIFFLSRSYEILPEFRHIKLNGNSNEKTVWKIRGSDRKLWIKINHLQKSKKKMVLHLRFVSMKMFRWIKSVC